MRTKSEIITEIEICKNIINGNEKDYKNNIISKEEYISMKRLLNHELSILNWALGINSCVN